MSARVWISLVLGIVLVACGGASNKRAKIKLGGSKGDGRAPEVKALSVDKDRKMSCLNLAELFDSVAKDQKNKDKKARVFISDIRVLEDDDDITSMKPFENDVAQRSALYMVLSEKDDTLKELLLDMPIYRMDYAPNFKSTAQIKEILQGANKCDKVSIKFANKGTEKFTIHQNSGKSHLILTNEETDVNVLVRRHANNHFSITRFIVGTKHPTSCESLDTKSDFVIRVEVSYEWAYNGNKAPITAHMADIMKTQMGSLQYDDFAGQGRQKKTGVVDTARVSIDTEAFKDAIDRIKSHDKFVCKDE